MKRIITIIAACFAFAAAAFAQDSRLEPGIYAVVDGTPTHLTYTNGTAANSSTNILGIELGNHHYNYKGETSGVQAAGKFIMVINPEKKVMSKTPKKYDPFIKSMTPNLVMIVPLQVDKNKRVYDEGTSIVGINTKRGTRVEFEWELVDENTFEITADFEPGEYAFIFKPAKLGEFDFTSIYGFYVAE